MKTTLNGRDVKEILESIKNEMIENKNLLIELDSAMGDGDLGLYMELGFCKISEVIKDMNEDHPGEIIIKSGSILSQEAPSTLGTLIATAFIRAGKVVKGKDVIDLKDLANMGKEAYVGIMQRGGAKLGEKTILDSIIPAINFIEKATKDGKAIEEIFKGAYDDAKKGVENSKMLKSIHGRAGYFGDSSIGKQDAGATAGMLIFKGIYSWSLKNNFEENRN